MSLYYFLRYTSLLFEVPQIDCFLRTDTFLQHIQKCELDDSIDSHTLAMHHATSTILLQEGPYYVTKQRSTSGAWVEIGRWMVPPGYPRFVVTTAMEAYNAFLLLTSDSSQTKILFFTLTLRLCNACELSHIYSVLSGDFDQLRKDLVLGLKGGALLSVIIRKPPSTDKPTVEHAPAEMGMSLSAMTTNPNKASSPGAKNAVGDYASSGDAIFQTIPRKHCKFSRNFIGSPMQIRSHDLLSTFLVLSDNGNVICFETGVFEVLWHVKSMFFLSNPIYMWVNKFGPDFVLKFRIKSAHNRASGNVTLSSQHSYDDDGK